MRQDILDAMHTRAESVKARRDIKARQHVMEGNFAHGIRFGMKNARWRRLWNVAIQEHLICTIQNINALLKDFTKRMRGIGRANPKITGFISTLIRNYLLVHLSISLLIQQASFFQRSHHCGAGRGSYVS
jgi:hypothetical protein